MLSNGINVRIDVKGDKHTSNYHHAQRVAISFIYRAKVALNPSDSAELEKCIIEGSVRDVRNLARKYVDFQLYTTEELLSLQRSSEYV